jgi:hypothetical protein
VRGAIIIPARMAEKNKTSHTSNYNLGFQIEKGNIDGKIKLSSSAGEKRVISGMSDPRARSSMTRSVGEEGTSVVYEEGKAQRGEE